MRFCYAVLALIAAIIAGALYRGDAFWCQARGIPLGTFWREPGFSIDRMPDMAGLVALVTGANAGLGLEVSRQLLRANATVVLACRDTTKCEIAAQALMTETSKPVRVVHVDLSDLNQVSPAPLPRPPPILASTLRVALPQVVRAAQTLERELSGLDLLVNNAGVAAQFPLRLTADGVEQTFQANFLGHFALTTRLLPLLERSAVARGAPSRVVHLTSGAHRGAPAAGVPLSLAGVNDGGIGAYTRYGMAKLASLAFSAELSRRHAATALVSAAVHPGVVATELLRVDNFAAMLGRAAPSAALCLSPAPPAPARADR